MCSVFDTVKFILANKNPLSNMMLQKLAYYCQAWSLVWDSEPLFQERIEAWANGPVISELYDLCRGEYFIKDISKGDANNLTPKQKETILSVLKYYGDKSPQWLSDLTHSEDPWRIARKGIPEGDRSNREITLASMEEYYSSLPAEN